MSTEKETDPAKNDLGDFLASLAARIEKRAAGCDRELSYSEHSMHRYVIAEALRMVAEEIKAEAEARRIQ